MSQPTHNIIKQKIILKKQQQLVSVYWNKYFFFYTLFRISNFNRLVNKTWPTIYLNYVNIFLYYFRYFSFVGKSYKISFSKSCINLNFNKSNINYIVPSSNISTRFLSKNKVFFKTMFCTTMAHLYKSLLKVRPQNMFTGRGIKLSQSILLKKKGKVSSYTSQTGIF